MKKLLMALVALPMATFATTYYVNGSTGIDSNSGTSSESPKKTIQAAINASANGDMVSVAEGTYKEDLNLAKRISLIAASPLKVTINGNQSGHCIQFATGASGSVIDGFVIYNGASTNSGNKYGAGIECCGMAATIRNCHFKDNGSGSQTFSGGLQTGGSGDVLVYNCLFTGNHAYACGGAVLSDGGGGKTTTFDRCTIYGNTCDSWNRIGGIGVANSAKVDIRNSIVWGNNSTQIGSYSGAGSGSITVSYSCISGGASGTGNTSSDPRFANASSGDFSLLASSPCINAGNPSDTDPDGTRADMGFSVSRISAGGESERADGLVAWYKLDGNANDSSGNGNNGIVHGAKPTTDRFGNANSAYHFDNWEYITVANSDSLNTPKNEITVATWVYIDDLVYPEQYGTAIFLSKGDWGKLQYGMQYVRNYNKKVVIGRSSDADILSCTNLTLPTKEWVHLACTFRDGVTYTYLNGNQVGSYTNEYVSLAIGDADLRIGRNTMGTEEFLHGSIDDLRIYNRALSSTEVKALCEDGGDAPTTVMYTATFDANGGTPTPAAITRKAGETYGTLPTVARDGYVFDGWYTAASGGTRVGGSMVVAKDIVLYAHWREPIVSNVRLFSFRQRYPWNGLVDVDCEVSMGEATECKIGLEFVNGEDGTNLAVRTLWVVGGEETNKFVTVRSGVQRLVWNANADLPDGYACKMGRARLRLAKQVEFDAAGGQCDERFRVFLLGEPYGTLPTPQRSGYRFVGWCAAAYDGARIDDESIADPAISVLTAKWEVR